MIINGPALLTAAPIKNMLPCKHTSHGVSHGLAEVGYDIRIKQNIRFLPHGVQRYGKLDQTKPIHPQISLTPGRFVLASAMEEFDMPTDLAGVVHDKSTWARRGLSVFNTVIEPGWKGFLTLELVYHGNGVLEIPAGSGIAQVIFHLTTCNAAYSGKYQDQANQPVEAISA